MKKILMSTGLLVLVFMLTAFPALGSVALTASYPYTRQDNSGGIIQEKESSVPPQIEATSASNASSFTGGELDAKEAAGLERYIIRLDAPPLTFYTGGIAGIEATGPQSDGKLDLTRSQVADYLNYLAGERSQVVSIMERLNGHSVRVIHEYSVTLNGLALWLTEEEAETAAKLPGVASVKRDIDYELATDYSTKWIGAPDIWDGDSGNGTVGINTMGEGIVVGVIDTGINPGNPSFADIGGDGYNHTNPRGHYYGVCDPGNPDYDPTFPCNDKLIGAYDFTSLGGNAENVETPLDVVGHGSHTASTAAGNSLPGAVLDAPTIEFTEPVSGVAPHANIISYRACYSEDAGGTCPGSALYAAIEQAILDGVDVINYSIIDSASDPWDPDRYDTQGFLAARAAGIFVSASAGNYGPQGATVGSPADAPWVLSVGASTSNRNFVNSLTQLTRDGGVPLPDIEGASITAGYGPAQIVYAGNYPNPNDPDGDPALCRKPYPAGTFHGEIVVGVRGGGIARVEKGNNVLQGGAGGFVLINDEASGDSLIADTHYLPAVNIGYADGEALKDWLASGSNHIAAIAGSAASVSNENGDIMASFSSRGPDYPVSDVIKPDVSAPGVDILAAGGELGEVTWYCWSGTSMSSPHAAGAAALLKALHPDWSPAEIQSALMTTATTSVLKEDKSTPATPFDTGAGRIDVSRAARAGFVLDDNYVNYIAANPSSGGDPTTINLPSLGNDAVTSSCSWTRVLRSTMDVDVTWTVSVVEPSGVTLSVSPSVFTLPAHGLQVVTVTADVNGTPLNEWLFGQVTFTPSTAETVEAHFPVAIQTRTSTLPNALQYKDVERNEVRTLDDMTSIYDITELTPTYYGLTPADVFEESLYQDPTPDDPMDSPPSPGNGTFRVIRDVVPGTKQLVAEIVESTSLDTDMFIWSVSAGKYVCESTSESPYEYCRLDNPDPGEYWIIVQNWESSDPSGNSTDDVKLAVAEVPGNDSNNLSVTISSGNTNVPAGQPFNLDIEWNLREMARYWYGAFSIGSDSANAGNLGTVNLDLHVLDDPIVVFPDANLDAAVRQAIDKPGGDIHQSDLGNLTMLEAESSGISDITGLEFCINLMFLDLWDNNISDITALSNLTDLFILALEDNQISDITPLSGLTNLWLLLVGGNRISDISSLGNLTEMMLLFLDDNLIENIAPLSNFTGLGWLVLSDNRISDISPLGNLTGIEILFLDGNLIEDIAPLSNLTNLGQLLLGSNRISDISPLGNLTGMELLFLDGNLISDMEPLSNMAFLQWLDLSLNEIDNISTLSTLTSLTALDLGYNRLVDIMPIANLINLAWLDLSGNDLSNISALSALTNLTALKLEDNRISDLTPLTNLSMLEALDLSANDISDVAPLSTLTNLTDLDLGCSLMSDLDFQLETFWGLELQAIASQIVEMASLPDSTGSTETHSGGEQTSDLGLASSLTNRIEQILEASQKDSHDNPKAGITSLPDFTNPAERHSGDKKTAHAASSSSSVESIKESIDDERVINTGDWMGNIAFPEGIASGIDDDSDGNQIDDIASELDIFDLLAEYVSGNRIDNLTPLANLGNLTWLNLSDNLISDISPLGNLTGLVYLDLGSNQIDDVTLLGNLTGLEELYLWNNRISDLLPLGNLTNLTDLYLWRNGISDISPLGNLINLNTLHLAWNPIRDISTLSELTGLTTLRLGLTLIGDISPLGNLTGLTDLGLSLTRISDISPLAGLTGLTDLRLTADRITDISPLSDLTNLTSLRLGLNRIYDISPICGLTNLKELRLPENQLSDISPISGLTGLTELRLSYNGITNISALSNLVNLTDLRLNENRITNISPLSGLNNLTTLDLEWNRISIIPAFLSLPELIYLNLSGNELVDISGIENLTNLTELAMWDNQISDISPLATLTNLIYLDLEGNQISDITALGNLTNLIELYLWWNQISDISPLSNLTKLTYLDMCENQISDITALGNLTSLIVLGIWENQISDISPLAHLTGLTHLDLDENQISDITALGNLTGLIYLYLWDNQISDISPLSMLTNLNYLDMCHNRIVNIDALGNLTSLIWLDLCANQISDIFPLVQNNGLGEGDTVDLEENPLSSTSINEYIPQLEQRGVNVWWTVPPTPTPYFLPVVPAAPTPTPAPTPEPTPVPTVVPCNWTGTWNTSWNTMVLVQTGEQVTGTYEYEGGRIVGVVSGNTLRGTWLQAPSYNLPDDGGDFEFTISSDCSSFTGNLRYGSTGDWEEDGWTGNRVSSPITTPTPVPPPTPAPTSGPAGQVMDLSGIVGEGGQALHDINFVTGDGWVRLSIGESAIIRTQDNRPLSYIGAEAFVGPFLAPLPEYHFVGSVYEFVPDGATFEPSLGVTMSYNHTWLPEKVDEEGLLIGYYDIATGQWTLLPSLVDIENNTVTAQISHFTQFAILGKEATAAAPLHVFLIIGPALAALIIIAVLLDILFVSKKRTGMVQ